MKRVLAATAIIAALLVAGCGGDDEEEPAAPDGAETAEQEEFPADKAAFIADADAICDSAVADETAALEDQYPEANPEQLTDKQVTGIVKDILIPSLETQIEEIGALPPPEGDEEEVDAILTGLEDGVGELQADPLAIKTGGEGLPKFADASRMAQEYGFQSCGS